MHITVPRGINMKELVFRANTTFTCFVVQLCSKMHHGLVNGSLFAWLCLHKLRSDNSLFLLSTMHMHFIYFS